MKNLIALGTLFFTIVLLSIPAHVVAKDPESPNFDDDPVIDGLPAGLQPWRDPDRLDVIKLDKGYDDFFLRKDRSDEKRAPGPINVQRYQFAFSKWAFPAYLGAPIALTPEDLKAGDVDVAIVGVPSDFNVTGGQGWAANQLRIIRTIDTAIKVTTVSRRSIISRN